MAGQNLLPNVGCSNVLHVISLHTNIFRGSHQRIEKALALNQFLDTSSLRCCRSSPPPCSSSTGPTLLAVRLSHKTYKAPPLTTLSPPGNTLKNRLEKSADPGHALGSVDGLVTLEESENMCSGIARRSIQGQRCSFFQNFPY